MSSFSDNVAAQPSSAPGVDTQHTYISAPAPSTGSASVSDTNGTASTSSPATANGNPTPIAAQLQNAGASAANTAQATLSSISNSQVVQDIKNGPVAQNVSTEATKTTTEFKDLYGSKDIPKQPAATGQPLTQYHSLFYRLLSWQNPRATAITFVGSLLFILAARYMNFLHYIFKFSYFILGITATLEIAGKVLFDDGLASKMRPRQYWTIPRESLERSLGDVEQLLNFFVIEAQRIVYAENVYATIGVFLSALVSYWLIKLVPFWGLAFISTCIAYLGPLVYVNNREAIDNGLQHAGNVVSSQASQIKTMTAERTSKATESLKSVTAEYTNKAQGYVGAKKNDLSSSVNSNKVSSNDFPSAPKREPVASIDPTATAVPRREPVAIIDASSVETEPLIAH